MHIKEIVTHDSLANFENDVQIGWYPQDPRNRRLVQSYIFTAQAKPGTKSSLEILDIIRLSYVHSLENRFVVLATYGHGKSHLALTLANFFGQPADSLEVQTILEKIEHCAGPSRAQGFREFKEGNAPFLVVRLRGDKAPALPQQFLQGLQTALREQGATRDVDLPFWFEKAAEYLQRIQGSAEQLAAANAFLEQQSSHPAIRDVPMLLQEVRNNNPSVHDLCRSLSAEMNHGVPLDFGGAVSLQYALEWVVDNYCGTDKPCRGVLILFDELSAYVRLYAQSGGAGQGNALQDILEGVRNRMGRATFVAFSQHDPMETSKNFFRIGGSVQQQETLEHQLSRLPKSHHYALHSSLETVLDSYLKQEEEGWVYLREHARDVLDDASSVTANLFRDRYSESQGWDLERVDEVLTRGCFPLHPLTTALLCSVRFQEVTSPRSVLGFLKDVLDRWGERPALQDHVPNWVYPIELVDWFGEMLADEEYQQYRSALLSAGADLTEAQSAVLKGMLLQSIAGFKTERYRYGYLMHLLTGLPENQCREALTQLSNRQVIRSDGNVYSFWPPGVDGSRLEKEINRIVQQQVFDLKVLERINDAWRQNRLQDIPVDCLSWAHSRDFAARQMLVTHEAFTPEFLRKHIKTPKTSGDLRAPRGYVFWLVAQSTEQLQDYYERARRVLDEALAGEPNPPPVLIGIPGNPIPEFDTLVLKKFAVDCLPENTLREVDKSVLSHTRDQYRKRVDDALAALKRDAEFVVPEPYRTHVDIQSPLKRFDTMLQACYQAAYRHGPPAFRNQVSFTTPSLCKAVGLLAEGLARNNLHLPEHAWRKDKVAKEIMDKFLSLGGSFSWKLVAVDYMVREPDALNVRKAWDYLNQYFVPGAGPLPFREAVLTLLSPPFGFDPSHVTLLLCAWYGYHQHEVKMRVVQKYATLDRLITHPFKTEDFLNQLISKENPCFLERVNRDETIQQAEELARQVVRGEKIFSISEVDGVITALREAALLQENNTQLIDLIHKAIERLEQGQKTAREYEDQTRSILQELERSTQTTNTLGLLKKIESLPPQEGCVRSPQAPSAARLRDQVDKKLQGQVETLCQKCTNLTRLEDYSHFQKQLRLCQQSLEKYGYEQLRNRIDEALQQLEERRQFLGHAQEDRAIQEKLSFFSETEGLRRLREFVKQLEQMHPHTDETQRKLDEKIQRIHQRIRELEHFVVELPDRFNRIRTLVEARQLRDEILRRQERFSDTPEWTALQSHLQHCEGLLTVLQEVEALRQRKLQHPNDVKEITRRANTLREEYRKVLSSDQSAIFDRLLEDLERKVELQKQEAIRWLEQLEREAAGSSEYASILERLAHPHSFLPPSTFDRVQTLKEVVQQKFDADIVAQISCLFRKIADTQKRQECLQMLMRLSRADTGV